MDKTKEKIKKLIIKKQKELINHKKTIEARKKEDDEKFSKQLDEDFRLKNTLNPFYKPKAMKMASQGGFGLILAGGIIQGRLESEIELLKSLLK